jgi:hypothetical protein
VSTKLELAKSTRYSSRLKFTRDALRLPPAGMSSRAPHKAKLRSTAQASCVLHGDTITKPSRNWQAPRVTSKSRSHTDHLVPQAISLARIRTSGAHSLSKCCPQARSMRGGARRELSLWICYSNGQESLPQPGIPLYIEEPLKTSRYVFLRHLQTVRHQGPNSPPFTETSCWIQTAEPRTVRP